MSRVEPEPPTVRLPKGMAPRYAALGIVLVAGIVGAGIVVSERDPEPPYP